MKRVMMLSFILILLVTTTAFQNFIGVEGQTQDVGYIIKMRVTYSNPVNGTRIWNFTEEDRTIGLFMNNTWQTAYLINHSYPLEMMKDDEDGNPIAVLRFPKLRLNPGENVSYTVAYRLLSESRSIPEILEGKSGNLDEIPKDLREKYCREGGPWLVNDTELQELAYSIAKNETSVLTIVNKFVTWINRNINYTVHEVPMYPNETYAEGRGDCDDKAVLFVTLCRIYKIPAYMQVGCIYMPTTGRTSETYWEGHVTNVLKQIGWHGWAIAFVPPWGWLPVDLTYVIGGLDDPLNAIKAGAVTLQETIQYLNITQTDYVAQSRESREFITENDFYAYMEDEMVLEPPTPTKPPEPPLDEIQGQPRLISILVITAAVGATLTGASMIILVLYVRKAKKEKSRE